MAVVRKLPRDFARRLEVVDMSGEKAVDRVMKHQGHRQTTLARLLQRRTAFGCHHRQDQPVDLFGGKRRDGLVVGLAVIVRTGDQ